MKLVFRGLWLAPFLTPVIASFAADPSSVPAGLHGQDAAAAAVRLSSRVFKFEDLTAKATSVGSRRDVVDLPTATFEKFECHITTLSPGQASHLPHTHPQEELIILREGSLEVNVNGEKQPAGPGSMFFFASNQSHAVQNKGTVPATYFVFNFTSAATRSAPAIGATVAPGRLSSTVWEWTEMVVKPTPKGARRDVVDSPTATLVNFESHVTTINPGEMPHAAHRHPDEEIILVKEGELDVTINGQTQHAGAGSILFYGSNDEHGMKNTGTIPATYHVIRIVTEVSAALAKK